MDFRSFGFHEETYVSSGNPEVEKITCKHRPDGSIEKAVVGIRNIYEEIQSMAEAASLASQIEFFARQGRIGELGYTDSDAIDSTVLPHSLQDVYNAGNKVSALFDSLPVEVREKYSTPELLVDAITKDPNCLSGVLKNKVSEQEKSSSEEVVKDATN